MDENQLKIKLVIDESSMKEFEDRVTKSFSSMKGGNSSIAKANTMTNNIELERVKIERELLKNSQQELKIEIMKKKESERQAKIEEKKTKLLEKQTKELGFFSKILGSMGFKGSAGGEIVRGGFRQLGYNIANSANDLLGNISGGLLSGNAIAGGVMTGAMIGSFIPLIGTAIGGLIGGLIGTATPFIAKMFEEQGQLNREYIDLITNKFVKGDIQTQLQVAGDVKTYQQQKNLLKLTSGDKMTEKQAGAFVSSLGSVGINAVDLYKQSLKLSKNKESEFYGQNPATIMDKIVTGLTSDQYTKEERFAFFDKLESSEGMKTLLGSVFDMNLLYKGIAEGGLQKNFEYYLQKAIDEKAVAKSVNYMTEDDITTTIDNLKLATSFVIKNHKEIVDYENALNAVRYASIEKTESLTNNLKNMNSALESADGLIGKMAREANNAFKNGKEKANNMFD